VVLRFYIDPTTNEPHIYGHDVNEHEVEDVLTRPIEDRPGSEGSRVAVGQTQAGRYLRVIYVSDPEPKSVFVITAYDLGAKALKALRRRQRRRKKS
jgi:hypothetical protein